MRAFKLDCGILVSVVVLWIGLGTGHAAESGVQRESNDLKQVNAQVADVDRDIERGAYPFVTVDETVPSEGVPPKIAFHYEPKQMRLVAITISVGHETWSSEFRYYFYPDGKPMKYTKAIKDRPDRPGKEGVIWSAGGAVLWKNCDGPRVSPARLVQLFGQLQATRSEFAAY